MPLLPYALATVDELKATFPLSGSGKDVAAQLALGKATREIEAYCGRRFVFRAPTEDADAIVASTALANGALVVAQPTAARTLVVRRTGSVASVPLQSGTLTITGTVAGASATEVYDLPQAETIYGCKFFDAIASAVVSGFAAAASFAESIQVGTSEGYCDYYSPSGTDLHLNEWPVRQVLTVHEDSERTYGSDTLLTEDDDWALATRPGRPRGALVRTSDSDGAPCGWDSGFRAVRVIYSAGYFGQANVPADLKGIAMDLAWSYYKVAIDNRIGISGMSDAGGNWTRFAPAGLTDDMRDRLDSYRDWLVSGTEGERGYDPDEA